MLPDSAQDTLLGSPSVAPSTPPTQTSAIPNSVGFSVVNPPHDITLATAGTTTRQASTPALPPRPPIVDLTRPTDPHAPGTISTGVLNYRR